MKLLQLVTSALEVQTLCEVVLGSLLAGSCLVDGQDRGNFNTASDDQTHTGLMVLAEGLAAHGFIAAHRRLELSPLRTRTVDRPFLAFGEDLGPLQGPARESFENSK